MVLPPIGRHLHYISRVAQKSFNAALGEAGGSLPMWLILLSIKHKGADTQQELARAVGIEGATLTHHLDSLEAEGLVTRTRHTADRRAIRVALTPAGEERFDALHDAASAFDKRLRVGISEDDINLTRDVLTRIGQNVAPGDFDELVVPTDEVLGS
ncbi:MAG: MarR family transcriptional regulator [Acidimicrobiia bacterium]|nr:MarR family transcriptional regulator [Acidimicrobiia bacterium]